MRRTVTALAAASLLFAACSDDDDAAPPDAIDLLTTTTTTTDNTTSTTDGATDDEGPADGIDDPATADGTVIRAEDGVLTDGVWAVGEAGTVEFALSDGGLELIEVVTAEGWSSSVDESSPDEIEVDFRRGNLDHQIEIEYEDGILEIEIDLDIDPADPGTFTLGSAGAVDLAVDGGSVNLVDLSVSDGWTVTEQDTDDGEVEIELRRDNVTWELDAEVDDGQLEVEIDFEIEGRYP